MSGTGNDDLLLLLDAKGNPYPAPDFETWCSWYADLRNRQLLYDLLGDTVMVSTLFLGLNVGTYAHPRLFATVIMGGVMHGLQIFSGTIIEARQNHDHAVTSIRTRVTPLEDFTNG